jgi:hypothetical protein
MIRESSDFLNTFTVSFRIERIWENQPLRPEPFFEHNIQAQEEQGTIGYLIEAFVGAVPDVPPQWLFCNFNISKDSKCIAADFLRRASGRDHPPDAIIVRDGGDTRHVCNQVGSVNAGMFRR